MHQIIQCIPLCWWPWLVFVGVGMWVPACHLVRWLTDSDWSGSEWPPQACHYRWLISKASGTTSPCSPLCLHFLCPAVIPLSSLHQLLTSNNHKSSHITQSRATYCTMKTANKMLEHICKLCMQRKEQKNKASGSKVADLNFIKLKMFGTCKHIQNSWSDDIIPLSLYLPY